VIKLIIYGTKMKLKEIVKKNKLCNYRGKQDPEITMICSDSRNVREGSLFVVIEGYRDSGLKYIEDAVKRGAKAIVVGAKQRNKMKKYDKLPVIFTDNTRKCSLLLARAFYNNPSKDIKLIGITGTNGKTTITYLIEEVLRESGKNPGVIGTISYRYNDFVEKAKNTTPDPIYIQSLYNEMKENNISHVIMEVSSHALIMDRVLPEDFDYAIFTNLSQDHLDFHLTIEDYFNAKAKLFLELKDEATAIINNDNSYGKRLSELINCRKFMYSIETFSDYVASDISLSIFNTNFKINGKYFKTHLVGKHNIYNILSVYVLAKSLNIGDEIISRALSKIKKIPGRFERVENDRSLNIFVDYAHTPDALKQLLNSVITLKKNRIITVFGCGGDRDKGKRPKMGSIAEEKSDIAIITSDNPRSENPIDIIGNIKKGLKKDNHMVIPDRREAIYKAVELAEKDDIVLIAGKGHEDYQILNDKTIHFDDRKIALEAINNVKK